MDDTLTQNNADITKNVNKLNKLLSIFIINRILSLATYWIHLSITEGKMHLLKWLNKHFRIEMTDGRILIGVFLCTDRDANVILGSCSEYLKNGENENEEPRVLGLVMVPGRHIVSIQLDDTTPPTNYYIED